MITWADTAGVIPASSTLDRDAGEGPKPRCCSRRFVSADALVLYGELASNLRQAVVARFKHLERAAADMYLCDSCRETLRRERVITREEMPSSRPLRNPLAL